MLSLTNIIQLKSPVTHLHRSGHILTGVNQQWEVIEVDTRNCLVDRRTSFITEQYQLPQINEVQFLQSDYGQDYYFSMEQQLVSASGRLVSESNAKATFCRGLDGHRELLVFGKYHKLHKKYSLNLLELGQEKRILELLDSAINKLHLIYHPVHPQILLHSEESAVLYHGQGLGSRELYSNVNEFYSDSGKVYLSSYVASQNGFQSGRSGRLVKNTSEAHEIDRVKIEAYDKSKLSKGRGYCQFEMLLNREPIRIDNFMNDLIIANSSSLEVYDLRKIGKPFYKQSLSGICDYLYEPNLQRIYISTQKGISIYDYK